MWDTLKGVGPSGDPNTRRGDLEWKLTLGSSTRLRAFTTAATTNVIVNVALGWIDAYSACVVYRIAAANQNSFFDRSIRIAGVIAVFLETKCTGNWIRTLNGAY